jgi:hypothetical protein
MGETADWLEDHPEEAPDMMADMWNEFLSSSDWPTRIRAEGRQQCVLCVVRVGLPRTRE